MPGLVSSGIGISLLRFRVSQIRGSGHCGRLTGAQPAPQGPAGGRFRRVAERTQFGGQVADSIEMRRGRGPRLRAVPTAPLGILRAAPRPPGAGVP